VCVCVCFCVCVHSFYRYSQQLMQLRANYRISQSSPQRFCSAILLSIKAVSSHTTYFCLPLSLSLSLIGIGYRTGEIKAANDNDVRQATL